MSDERGGPDDPASTSSSSGSSGSGVDADADASTGPDGKSPAAERDTCVKNVWAMPAGCRGSERHTNVLAPKDPQIAWTKVLPDERSILFGAVVDAAGRLYMLLGSGRALYRADPSSKEIQLVRKLTASDSSSNGLAIDTDGSILVVDEGKLLALDPEDGETKWQRPVADDDSSGEVLVEADGALRALSNYDYKAFDAAHVERWALPTNPVGYVRDTAILDAEGRSFSIEGALQTYALVGMDHNAAELFSQQLESSPGGWKPSATDGTLLYGARHTTDDETLATFGAIRNATGTVAWEEPMRSVDEDLGAVTVIGPGQVVFRTDQRLIAKHDGETAWEVALEGGDDLLSPRHERIYSDREGAVVIDTETGLAGYDANGEPTFALEIPGIMHLYPAQDGALWAISGDHGELSLSLLGDD